MRKFCCRPCALWIQKFNKRLFQKRLRSANSRTRHGRQICLAHVKDATPPHCFQLNKGSQASHAMFIELRLNNLMQQHAVREKVRYVRLADAHKLLFDEAKAR